MTDRAPSIGRDDDAIFVKDGVPVKFCFHKSVTQGRGRITRDVERHGGQIVPHERLANVLLIDEQENLAFFRRRYYSSTELYRLSLYVEPRGFVRACIRAGTYHHTGPVKQGMPGRAPGAGRRGSRIRVPFTEEDKDHLAYYIATRCPTRDGRMGNNPYKDLERLGQTEDRSWAWARRHTAHSWREHYKMNPETMDLRIDQYLQQLKDVGHHFGHDLRRHDLMKLEQELQEEEEGEDDEEEEEEEGEGRGPRRQDHERREQIRPAVAERRPDQAARNHLARREQDLVTSEEEGSIQEVAIDGPQHVKRHRVRPDTHRQRGFREARAKRARVSEASTSERRASGVEVGCGEGSPSREEGTGEEEPQEIEIEGSDLFGDRAYEDALRLNLDDTLESFSRRASPVPEQDGPPLSTQATLISSPRSVEKEPTPAPAPANTSTKVVEVTLKPTISPSSQQTLVMTQERVVVQRARVRGASAQPGPSMPKETRTQGSAATVDAPHQNPRARSRSVDPQPQPQPQPPLSRESQGGRGKEKAKEVMFNSTKEDIRVEERQREGYAEEDVGPVSVTMRETSEDEMVVEGLLEASVEDEMDEEDRGSDGGKHDEGDGSDGDEDEDSMPELPRFQEIEIEGEPSDSDDAETHESLVRGVVREGSADGGDASKEGEPRSDQDREQNGGDSDSDDADRIKRMASGTLHAASTPIPLPPRVTRSMTATQIQAQTQQISPRRTRSGNQVRAAPRPTPGSRTKARAAVDRFQEEERRTLYVPPPGTRAARAVKGRGRRG